MRRQPSRQQVDETLARPYDGGVFVRVNEQALKTFVDLNRECTGHPNARELVELAANALLAAGVLEWIGENDKPQQLPPAARLDYADRELTLRSESRDVRTTPAHDVGSRALAELAHQLAGALNQRPHQGPWPKQFDF
jgi:hypothetical protein